MMTHDMTQTTQESVTGEDRDEEDEEGRPEETASINVSIDEENYIWPQFFSRIRETLYLGSSSAAQEQSFSHLQMVCNLLKNLPDTSLIQFIEQQPRSHTFIRGNSSITQSDQWPSSSASSGLSCIRLYQAWYRQFLLLRSSRFHVGH
jgi:hypothetical protein